MDFIMRPTTLYQYILGIACILLSLGLHAQVVSDTVNVTAGNLSTQLGSQKDVITDLTLKGGINGVDIGTIRSMAKLSVINMSDVNIEIGGSYYIDRIGVFQVNSANMIPDYAFYQLFKLTSVAIPNSVINIGNNAFSRCSGLTSVSIPNGVLSIGNNAFASCTGLTSVFIPNSVTSIGNNTFSYCSGLTSITIPGSVTSIGYNVFSDCKGLTGFIVSEDNTVFSSLDGVLFNKNKTQLIAYPFAKSSIYAIPDNVNSIGDGAFSYCTGLTSISVPNSVNSIGNNAFNGCVGLTSINIPDNVSFIGNNAFYNCRGLTSVTIPSSLTSISYYAFYNCTGLISITIPGNVASIGNFAFSYCTGLSAIVIPNSVTSIGDNAFSFCSRLKSVTIPDNVTSIGNWAFYSCDSLISVTIPNGVTNIYERVFSGCKGLTSVKMPDSVTFIGNNAFSYCTGLTSITIPVSVNSIDDEAFTFCTGLTEIHSKALTPPSAYSTAFNGVDKIICKLYVPMEALTAYRNAIVWSEFTNIIKEEPTATIQIKAENIKVYTERNVIVVAGAEYGDVISVYSEVGVLLYKVKATDDIIRFYLPANHTYLIKIVNKSFKVAL